MGVAGESSNHPASQPFGSLARLAGLFHCANPARSPTGTKVPTSATCAAVGGGDMPWHVDLHVWTHVANPAGVFASWNPNVTC